MAIELSAERESPESTVVSSFSLHRLDEHPSLDARMVECVPVMEPELDPETGEPMTDPQTGEPVMKRSMNRFGIEMNRKARSGKEYELTVSSRTDEGFERLRTMLFEIHHRAVMEVLTEIGNTTVTADDVQAGIASLSHQRGVSIESIIVEGIEKIERDRRAGTAPYVTKMDFGA